MSKMNLEQERHALTVLSPRLKKTGWAMIVGGLAIFIYAFFSPIPAAIDPTIEDPVDLGIPEEHAPGIEPGELAPEVLFASSFLFATIGIGCIALSTKMTKKLKNF